MARNDLPWVEKAKQKIKEHEGKISVLEVDRNRALLKAKQAQEELKKIDAEIADNLDAIERYERDIKDGGVPFHDRSHKSFRRLESRLLGLDDGD